MAILNYTSEISPHKTVAEIQAILGMKGCKSISITYDVRGNPTEICFVIAVAEIDVPFRLPRNAHGVLAALKLAKNKGELKSLAWSELTMARAEIVSWRILKDWIEAQLAIIEAGQASMEQVFLPYAVVDVAGNTAYERFLAGKTEQRILSQGGDSGQ